MAMWRNGYSPLPCHDKRPAMDACQNHHETNAAKIHLWDRLWPYDRNAGCLTRTQHTDARCRYHRSRYLPRCVRSHC
jgi:hypothetical protein